MLRINAVIVFCMTSLPRQSRCISAVDRPASDFPDSLSFVSKICANEQRDRS